MRKDAADTIEEWFHEAGWEIICKTDRVNPPGYSIHEVGTCRMGDDPKKSVLNKWCQSHDVKNLFVVDGASFVTLRLAKSDHDDSFALYAGLGISGRSDAHERRVRFARSN